MKTEIWKFFVIVWEAFNENHSFWVLIADPIQARGNIIGSNFGGGKYKILTPLVGFRRK